MRCKFCFATFQDVKQAYLPKGHLPREEAVAVVRELAAAGFAKITFAGGEPTLCPWLPILIRTAKAAGMTTMLVTNGSKLTDAHLGNLQESLDWIAVSIDSLHSETNLQNGRAIAGRTPLAVDDYLDLITRIKSFGYKLKINTVVCSTNFREDFRSFIRHINPARWKVFQVLPIRGQNDACIDDFAITDDQFRHFLDFHHGINCLVPETNEIIKGSYVMVDPAGRFFDDVGGEHHYSRPILDAGWKTAIGDVDYDGGKFLARGGLYRFT